MGMQNPVVNEPIDKLAEVFPEGKPFTLLSARIVDAKTANFGTGKMVIIKVAEHERELGVWGRYLLAQVEAADPSDFNKQYVLNRRMIPGFDKAGEPVKVFDPYVPTEAAPAQTSMPAGEGVQGG